VPLNRTPARMILKSTAASVSNAAAYKGSQTAQARGEHTRPQHSRPCHDTTVHSTVQHSATSHGTTCSTHTKCDDEAGVRGKVKPDEAR
jgi:hypothetical protein